MAVGIFLSQYLNCKRYQWISWADSKIRQFTQAYEVVIVVYKFLNLNLPGRSFLAAVHESLFFSMKFTIHFIMSQCACFICFLSFFAPYRGIFASNKIENKFSRQIWHSEWVTVAVSATLIKWSIVWIPVSYVLYVGQTNLCIIKQKSFMHGK